MTSSIVPCLRHKEILVALETCWWRIISVSPCPPTTSGHTFSAGGSIYQMPLWSYTSNIKLYWPALKKNWLKNLTSISLFWALIFDESRTLLYRYLLEMTCYLCNDLFLEEAKAFLICETLCNLIIDLLIIQSHSKLVKTSVTLQSFGSCSFSSNIYYPWRTLFIHLLLLTLAPSFLCGIGSTHFILRCLLPW